MKRSEAHRDTVLAYVGIAWEIQPECSFSELVAELLFVPLTEPAELALDDDEVVEECQALIERHGMP